MKAATFKSIRDGILRKMGLDSSLAPLPSQAAAIADYVQGALDRAWDHFPWPDVTLVEERTPTGSPAHEIDFDQPNETPIGDFLQIYDIDPEDDLQPARSLRFATTGTGATLDPDHHTPGTPVFVRFRIPAPLFSAREYSPSTAYLAGDVVYHDPTGDCYLALASTTGNPPTDPSFWRRQLIPTYLGEYSKAHAYSSTLLEDGQFDKANYMLARAEGILAEKQDDFWMKRQKYHHYTAAFNH